MELISRVLLLGLVVLAGLLLFTPYESFLEGALAVAIVGVALMGSLIHPRREMYYVRTAKRIINRNWTPVVEHDYVAVKVELTRLWLLFLPTALAVAFLVFFATAGPEKFSALNWALSSNYAVLALHICEVGSLFVLFLLSAWISERRVMRDAAACAARSFNISHRRVSYQFMGEHGEYFGGYCLYVGLVQPFELANIVFHNVKNPDLNKIAMGFLFHRFTVVGRGVTDLDRETVAALTPLADTTQ